MGRPIPTTVADDVITVHYSDGDITITPDDANFTEVRDKLKALPKKTGLERGSKLARDLKVLMSAREALKEWSNGILQITPTTVKYDGLELPKDLRDRILGLFNGGDLGWVAFANFWTRLQRNPSRRSVQQLFKFLTHKSLPICPEGYLYVYKGVQNDYLDSHSRTFSNKPGTHLFMQRNRVSDDPTKHCDVGFHVGTRSYANSYGRLVICRVDPADCARVPNDSSQKMGVSQYHVIGDATDMNLPSGIWIPGEDKYCKNYIEAAATADGYKVVITSPSAFNRPAAVELLKKLGFDERMQELMKKNLPFVAAPRLGAQYAKDLYDAIGRQNGGTLTPVALEGFVDPIADKLIKAPKVKKKAPAPAVKKAVAAAMAPETETEETAPKTLPAPVGTDDLDSMNRAKLREVAKGLGIPRYSKPGAGELRLLIRNERARLAKAEKTTQAAAARVKEAEKKLEKTEVPEPKGPTYPTDGELDEMSREALRQFVRENCPKAGYSKWGAGALRAHISAWRKEQLGKKPPEKPKKAPPAARKKLESLKKHLEKKKEVMEAEAAEDKTSAPAPEPEPKSDPAPAPEPEDGDSRPDLEKLNRKELRAIAKDLGIVGYSKPGAAALRELIQKRWDMVPKKHDSEQAKQVRILELQAMDRGALRAAAREEWGNVSHISKLGAGHLRWLIFGLEFDLIDYDEISNVQRDVRELKKVVGNLAGRAYTSRLAGS